MPAPRLTTADRVQGAAARALGRLPLGVQRRLSGEPAVVVDGQTLDPQLQLARALRRRLKPFGLCEPSPAAGRARFVRDMLVFGGLKTAVGSVRDFTIDGDDAPLAVRHYAPVGNARQPLTVFLHGGGFVIGDLDTHDETCRLLCRHANVHVLSVDYRLAPEHPFPLAIHDTLSAFRWARENAGSLGADPARVAVGGDSAGANLAAVVSQHLARGGAAPVAQLLIYPPTDADTVRPSRALFGEGFFLTLTDRDLFFQHYLGDTGVTTSDPRVSPLLAPDLSDLPPAVIATAGFDLLRDEGEAYADALRGAGSTVRARRFPSLSHGFVNMTGVCAAAHHALVQVARDWRALLDDLPR